MSVPERLGAASVAADVDGEGLATGARLVLDRIEIAVEPRLWSPVLLTAPDGRLSRFPRALSHYTTPDARRGAGWIEFNQVQRP